MAPDAPINGVLAGALIAKIGEYSPIAIGDQTPVTAPVSGRLYLGVNDDHLPDNRGEFTVMVGVQRRNARSVCATGGWPRAAVVGEPPARNKGHKLLFQGLVAPVSCVRIESLSRP